jgi:hypothetical protein
MREKLAGICCTTRIGGNPLGRLGNRKRNASMPPVDAPIRMTRRDENSPGGIGGATGVTGPAAGVLRRRDCAAAFT